MTLSRFILISFTVVSIIVYSIFNSTQLISNSEESLNFYKPSRAAKLYSSAWYEVDTGKKNPFNLTKYPTFVFLSYLEALNLPIFLIQVLFLAFFMIAGLISAYLLSRFVFQFDASISQVFALFYLLNLFTISQVWRRFLYSGIAGWAFLPLFLLCWIKILKEKELIWIVFFLASSFIFAITFGQPGLILSVWTPAIVYFLIRLIQNRKSIKEFLKIFLIGVITIFLWLLSNFWWIHPVIRSSASYISTLEILSPDSSFNLLSGVSTHFHTHQILLLRQGWWFGPSNHWYGFYSHPLIYLISIIILILAVIGWLKLRKRSFWVYLTSLIFVGWFISKGTNPPLGETFFLWLFNAFPFMGVLRNSYEKFGLVFLLPYSIFLAYGLFSATEHLTNMFKKFSRIFLLTLILIVLNWPLWTGRVFLDHEHVTVPHSYKLANQYLNSLSSERILQLPYLKYGNVKYNWGYLGQNPNEYLFDRQSISGPIEIKLFDDYILTSEKFNNQKNYLKIMGLIGASNIIWHKDMVEGALDWSTYNKIENWNGAQSKKEFEHLIVYSINKELVKPRVYVAFNITKVNNLEEGFNSVFNRYNGFVYEQEFAQIKSKRIPQISFSKIANDNYLVNIQGVQEPFILVLNNTFDNGWKAIINNRRLDKHFLINGLMNGWLIEKKGSFTIEIKF